MPGTAHSSASGTHAYRTHRTGSAHDNDIQVSVEENDDSLRLPAAVPHPLPESGQGETLSVSLLLYVLPALIIITYLMFFFYKYFIEHPLSVEFIKKNMES